MFQIPIPLAILIVAVLSYLLGSISTGIIVSRLHAKDDIRKHGSGSAGMTNILRTYGVGPAVITFLGDSLKGVVAVFAARLIFFGLGITFDLLDPAYIAGLFVLLGHLFPLYFHFKGGKGVATALGIILVIDPLVFLVLVILFVPVVFLTRIVSLSSILGAVFFPITTFAFHVWRGREPLYDTVCAAVIGLIILVMHRENIQRLLNGTENKFTRNQK